MEKSTHQALCVNFAMRKHPDADSLSIVDVDDGYTYVARSEDWVGITKAVYFPPDSLLPTNRSEFQNFAGEAKYDEFSNCVNGTNYDGIKYYRVKAKRLRGIVSYGFMIPAPEGANLGDNLAEFLGVKHYEAELIAEQNKTRNSFLTGGEVAKAPDVICPSYDVDAFLKYGKKVFEEGEDVIVLEKLEGANGAFVFHNGEFHCKSRNEWKKEFASPPKITLEELIEKMGDEEKAKYTYERNVVNFKAKQNLWWGVLRANKSLQGFLQKYPDHVVFGEVYGQVKGFPYDGNGKPKFRIFDIMKDGKFLDFQDVYNIVLDFALEVDSDDLELVPILNTQIKLAIYPIKFDFDKLVKMADGMMSTIGNNIAEGICVRPVKERWDEKIGRVHLKDQESGLPGEEMSVALEDFKIGDIITYNVDNYTNYPVANLPTSDLEGEAFTVIGMVKNLPTATYISSILQYFNYDILLIQYDTSSVIYYEIPISMATIKNRVVTSGICTCSINDLMIQGCACGALKKG